MKKDVSSGELATIIADARPINPRRKWVIGFSIFVLLGLIFWFFSRNDDHDTGPTYETQNLTRGNISLVVTATGNLAPTNQVTVGSELSGTVSDVFVDTNDIVKKDQPMAQLDTTKLTQLTERSRAILLAAKARVSQANATLLESSAKLTRFQDLHRISDGKTPSKADMETANASVDRAQADL
ncbi:MAG: biotin/lipoyl-binding protein [Akkermansiaceae bacterium]|nr:biotin/lipoyl-binding protein [Akkermansiaceae bacterium]